MPCVQGAHRLLQLCQPLRGRRRRRGVQHPRGRPGQDALLLLLVGDGAVDGGVVRVRVAPGMVAKWL